ncbi:MAG: sulfate ABC transporter permease subunit CysW [Ignavibacteria bacterium]|nr:sulfate ABC transporter permease subunit CysW [Ignavibacteria bacterium]
MKNLQAISARLSVQEAPMHARNSHHLSEPFAVRRIIIGATLIFVGIFLVAPLLLVFTKAFENGLAAFFAAISEPDALAAIRLTLLAAAIAVPFNVVFGLVASWLIAKFDFPGKSILTTLIDLPFTVSPVVSGMIFVLLFGLQGWVGEWLDEHGMKIVFAIPGIILTTMFVTFPFVARELIPIMQTQGTEEEQAALVLGAGGWKTFFRVTLPNIKWGLIFGIILCNARAMGEFGAVSVVSGHIRGLTNTIPLHVEILYNEYHMNAAFAVASLLTFLALATLIVKKVVEWKLKEKLIASSSSWTPLPLPTKLTEMNEEPL